ncbi:MAG: hypothetical protein K0R78_994 [Pelosinus sp.]|jgi:hypothetical protein|nr:hypothetical protein [Pelosinus sp.]
MKHLRTLYDFLSDDYVRSKGLRTQGLLIYVDVLEQLSPWISATKIQMELKLHLNQVILFF